MKVYKSKYVVMTYEHGIYHFWTINELPSIIQKDETIYENGEIIIYGSKSSIYFKGTEIYKLGEKRETKVNRETLYNCETVIHL